MENLPDESTPEKSLSKEPTLREFIKDIPSILIEGYKLNFRLFIEAIKDLTNKDDK
ncbi:hypothetical protein HZA39_00210 [Candidatus Peregrinibacteria bacterium]|nr:hypothetical protein [Candidatus Peregrinibacteria bacterium]